MSNKELNLNCLQHYMFSSNHIMNFYQREEKKDVENILKKPKKSYTNNVIPKENDTLFWCFYIIQNGQTKYDMLGNKAFQEEKEQKIKIVETLRNHKELLKLYKWKRNTIEADLVYNEKITLDTFLCICKISNINVAVLKKRCFYTLVTDINLLTDINIIEFKDNRFGYNILSKECAIDKFNKYCLEYWLIDNISKPLMGQSKYKIAALHDICKKLDIPIINHDGKKCKKVELYNLIKLKI